MSYLKPKRYKHKTKWKEKESLSPTTSRGVVTFNLDEGIIDGIVAVIGLGGSKTSFTKSERKEVITIKRGRLKINK